MEKEFTGEEVGKVVGRGEGQFPDVWHTELGEL